jgi:hypothetical protein
MSLTKKPSFSSTPFLFSSTLMATGIVPGQPNAASTEL